MEHKRNERIEVKNMKSKYCKNEHLNIVINDIQLDVWLDQKFPGKDLLGLVPTMTNWLNHSEEIEFLRRRYVQQKGVLPILMCPDDCDFHCTLIVAEFHVEHDAVRFEKIGIDHSTGEQLAADYDWIGTVVEWFDDCPRLFFDKEEYFRELNKIYRGGHIF
ncbi:hypothetical protein [Candidatus Pristimantibacillus sp. PTI5]|uniref:hypothetical protein n=1 Tax=Candidatus Pristimantibacillus sp. PTI5 TaxID=3400422 RepID=UPI003B021C80